MEDTIIISDDEDEAQLPTKRNDCNVIDLTNNHCTLGNLSELDSSVIDLTTNEDGLGLSPVSSPFNDPFSNSDGSGNIYLPSNSSSGTNSEDEWTSGCSWAPDHKTTSDLQKDVSTSSEDECLTEETSRKDEGLIYKSNHKEVSDTALSMQGWSPLPTPGSGESSSHYATTFPDVHYPFQSNVDSIPSLPTAEQYSAFPNVSYKPCSNGGSISPVPTAEQPPTFLDVNRQPHSNGDSMSLLLTTEQLTTQSFNMDTTMLYKLRCFKKLPVSHFLHGVKKPVKSGHLKPIPQSRMSIVNNTRDESIHQGTLYFLSEFVNAEHYPSKDIILHVIQSILLGAEEQAIKLEAYLTLMKVQKLHPADVNTVAWNWSLLTEVMERKESHAYHLFFQYVVQTLDDDFQIHLQRRCFKKSLCKKELSCDTPNIKNVITWLIHAVENACDIELNGDLNARSECVQRLVFLLQRMLSIAVEVDNLPVTNSNRIADLLFPHVIVLKTRQQRELFFSSTENHLLRAKVLELIFVNSCDPVPPPDLPLSLRKILHFVCKSTLLLENRGLEWQRWDEKLHHICLLFLSLQRIISDRLRTPITDRADEIHKRPQLQLPLFEDVTEREVEHCMSQFMGRSACDADVPVELQNRFYMLKSLLLTAVKRPLI